MNIFFIIPEQLLDEDLSSDSILLLGLLYSRSKRVGYVYTTNKYLADKLNCSTRTISNLIKELKDKKFIYIEDGKSYKRKIYVSYIFPS